MTDPVECHSGYTYAERPVALQWEGRRRAIEEVLDHWRTPGGICFRVKTTEGQIFKLYFNEMFEEWHIDLIE